MTDRRTDGRGEGDFIRRDFGQTDEGDFIRRCPTKVKGPVYKHYYNLAIFKESKMTLKSPLEKTA